jgi:4-hydroxy-tetrahydrodipicolinate reductase
VNVAIYGAGQAGTAVAALLRARAGITVHGPFGRDRREAALAGGADVVVIATTSFLDAIAPDVREAVEAGANVLTTAEEAAYPWAVDAALADELDALARARGVTILGAGLNPGLAFDALVLTVAGAVAAVRSLRVERRVDLSGFSRAVLHRIGIGLAPETFARATGHIGFPQSMHVVAARLGVGLERIDRELVPAVAERAHAARHLTVRPGETAGFEQRYVGVAGGRPWFEAVFAGHVEPGSAGWAPRDAIHVDADPPLDVEIAPGIGAQSGSAAVLANSVRRVAAAPAGWLTVADLPPAAPG